MPETTAAKRLGTWESLRLSLSNPRFRAVALQSFASGLPLGLVWIAMPAWLKYLNVDLKTIGLFSLTQAPWNFKFLWSPLMDRWWPKFLGRKRGWMIVTEAMLMVGIVALAQVARSPQIGLIFLLGFVIAFASASQDIVIDGYAVEVLAKEELGKAVGARIALYRVGMYLTSGVAITVGQDVTGWPLFLVDAAILFLPMMFVVFESPEPDVALAPPKSLRDAIVEPFLGMFRKRRAIEVLLFIVLYKLGENLATALIRPFLIEKGFTPLDVGVVLTSITFFTTVGGSILGGLLSDSIGMGRTLWLSGILQALGCLGYALVDRLGGPTSSSPADVHRWVMYGALAMEQVFQGMGAGALGVLMLRLTAKEFSATQFALLSSLMALPRVIVGPFAGALAASLGWTPFFLFTVPVALPGLVMLRRFVPFFAREAQVDDVTEAEERRPVTPGALVARAGSAFAASLAIAIGWSAFLGGMSDSKKAILDAHSVLAVSSQIAAAIGKHLHALLAPASATEWVDLAGPVVFAILIAGATAALVAARRGVQRQ